jgi:ribose-phosphate pyrophosphokinase
MLDWAAAADDGFVKTTTIEARRPERAGSTRLRGRRAKTLRVSPADGLPWLRRALRPGISRRQAGRLLLFSGRSNPGLAKRIASELGCELGQAELETFANGEVYCRYPESIRGADVFILQTGSPPVNDHLVELLVMVDAAKLASAHRITAVVPLYPYARQDKKSAPREPISAKLVAELLQVAGIDRILTMDLHAGQIQGFFSIPVDHMTALPLFAGHFRAQGLQGSSVVCVSPDLGRVKLARRLSRMLDAEIAVANKTRPRHEVATVTQVIGDVRGKIALIGDDMIVTGGTILAAEEALRAAGAREVRAFATHPLFATGAIEALAASELAEIAVTDTVALDPHKSPAKLTVLTVSRLLAQTIRNVFGDASVSAIFAGEELF